jgi:hypothetical protein
MLHPRWKATIQKEINSILENRTCELVHDIPAGKTPIHVMWIFKSKTGPTGQIEKLKARVVAKRNEQVHGIDYLETFAPVVCWTTIHSIIPLAAKMH